jgi:streptomycin 6-kinase
VYWRGRAEGAEWLARLPRLVAECAERWSLEVGPMLPGANVAYVAPATLADGGTAVLKVNFPDVESEREADALEHWNGEGAVRLLRHDPERRALLVERCEPGDELWTVSDEEEANRTAARVLLRLWARPAPVEHRFRLLEDEAARWAEELPAEWMSAGRPFERSLVERAAAALRELGPAQGEQVVLHQDFHGGNVLRAEREPWLAIDPKPLVGEREFDVASLLRDRREELARDPTAHRRIRRRLDQLSAELGLDRERMRGWAVAHALAWGLSGTGANEEHVACARWLAAA